MPENKITEAVVVRTLRAEENRHGALDIIKEAVQADDSNEIEGLNPEDELDKLTMIGYKKRLSIN